ncbi:MAG: rod shape-determining protein MreC [Oscillospiraceae bacterium]|jgi:rod shape-determining protein MreC|nr:rod shape-determining protein MreC [Oscillospiraceae bacterium]
MAFSHLIFPNKTIRACTAIFGFLIMFSGFALFFRTFPENQISVIVDAAFLKVCKSLSWVEISLRGLYEEIRISREANEELAKLKSEVAKLRDMTIDYYDIKRENARLMKYYDLKQKNSQIKFANASVIGRIGNSIFINSGSFDGISRNNVVITENGLVGRVSRVNALTSTVKTIFSPEISIGAEDSVTNGIGVLAGGIKDNPDLICLGNIASRDSIKVGDFIAISGLSGLYPRGIKIGEIMSVDCKDSNYYATVKPFEKISEVRDVFIITDFPGKGKLVLQE